ncbi:unnamed protein product [Polarella glacialis]|uniref:Uncharacterized protein n=1 Tax=Polarella glacialis TaxID=89957 RepID=A0A813D8B7_POLGL|nr:unnamed protein product [Polarella glacialis]
MAPASALQLHVRIDSLARCGGQVPGTADDGAGVLAAALPLALERLGPTRRAALVLRLRQLLHDSVSAVADDKEALGSWEVALSDPAAPAEAPAMELDNGASSTLLQLGQQFQNLLVPPGASVSLAVAFPSRSSSSTRFRRQGTDFQVGENAGVSPVAAAAWGHVLHFAISLEALAHGMQAVSRSFLQMPSAIGCWEGHDVTFHEQHFVGIVGSSGGSQEASASPSNASPTRHGSQGWCKAFSILPSLKRARTVRLASFANTTLRMNALSLLQRAMSELCPEVLLLSCSFCELHTGDQIDLPTPRHLLAVRRSLASPTHRRKGGGLLMGNGPLTPAADGSRGFELRIEALSPGERLDIGVTAQPPHEHFNARGGASLQVGRGQRPQVAFAEDLLSSWVVESSGLLVGSHAGLRIRDDRWDARKLCAGQVLQLRISPDGELLLGVNGKARACWRAQIPLETPLFPVVDLFEGSPVVRIFLAIVSTITDLIGKQLVRFSTLLEQRGAFARARTSLIAGIVISAVAGPLLDLGAYAFAPASLLAPFASMDVIWNAGLAPWLLNEKLTRPRCSAIVLVFTGTVIAGIFGPSEDRHYTCEGVEELVVSLRTPIYLAVLLCGILFSTSVLSRRPRGDPIRGMALGLTAGTLSGNMFCVKLLIELLQISYNTSWESVWGTWLPYPLLIGAAFFAISNLFFLTKGMREYQALFMVTVFEGAGMVTNAVSASVILRELDYMEWWRVLLYAFGLCTICFGMFVLCRSEFRVVKEDDIDFTPGEGIQGVDDINVTPGQGEDAKGLGPGAGVEASNLEEQAQIGNGSKSKKGPGACFCFAKAF